MKQNGKISAKPVMKIAETNPYRSVKRGHKHVTQTEYEEIHRLDKEGVAKKKIGLMIGRPEGTIYWVLSQNHQKESPHKRGKYEMKEPEIQDLSKLLDTELFQHSKEYIL